LITSLQV
jgi:hypothetical protein